MRTLKCIVGRGVPTAMLLCLAGCGPAAVSQPQGTSASETIAGSGSTSDGSSSLGGSASAASSSTGSTASASSSTSGSSGDGSSSSTGSTGSATGILASTATASSGSSGSTAGASTGSSGSTGPGSSSSGSTGGGPIIFGMFTDTAISPAAEGSSSQNWRAIADRWYPSPNYKVRRSFNSGLPSSFAQSAAAHDPANGLVSFLSVKPPNHDFQGVAAGTYDNPIRALAATLPAGTFFTMYHEPENDMTGVQFAAMFRRFYSVAKAANPDLTIGYVAMAYQWRPSSTTTTTPDDWYPGDAYTDFLGVDAYDNGFQGPHSLENAPDFQRWYQWALGKNKPLIIPEFGVENALTGGFSDATVASVITSSMQWVATQTQIKMVLYWDGTSNTPGGQSHILNPTTSHTADDFPLARAAWDAAIAQYGSASTSL